MGTEVIAITAYDPVVGAQYLTTGTFADMDATNLAVTFTAPASGSVLVRLTCQALSAGGVVSVFWGLREGNVTVAGPAQVGGNQANQSIHTISRTFLVSGLTPGSVHTYKWAASHDAPVWGMQWGTFLGSPRGAAVMEVIAAP